MFNESKNAETVSLESRNQSTRRRKEQVEAPHCVTCCCLTDIKCSYNGASCYDRYVAQRKSPVNYNLEDYASSRVKLPSESSIRHRIATPGSATIHELLRDMKLAAPSDEETETCQHFSQRFHLKNHEDGGRNSLRRRRRRRPKVSCSNPVLASRHPIIAETSNRSDGMEMRIHSCDRWANEDEPNRSLVIECNDEQLVIPTMESAITCDSVDDSEHGKSLEERELANLDSREERRVRNSGTRLLVDPSLERHSQDKDRQDKVSVVSNETTFSKKMIGTSEPHIRELKLVRSQVIQHIHEEVNKLCRLQRHLDSCSPRRRRTRSACTMTSMKQPE